MPLTIILLHNQKLYRYQMLNNYEMTFGSHKKDSVPIEDMTKSQISVKIKNNGVNVYTKNPYVYLNGVVPLNQIILLYEKTNTALFLCESTGIYKETIKLPYNCTIRIGRDSKNNVVIKNKLISGKHCEIKSENGIIYIEDLKSTNGVYVNGKKVNKARLKSGDVISLLQYSIHLIDAELQFEDVGQCLEIKGIEKEHAFNPEIKVEESGSWLKYKRSPRTQEQLPTEAIILASAPSKGQKFEKSRGMLASLAGSGAMVASSLAMGAASPALMAARAATLVMPVSSIASQKSGNKRRKKKLEEYEILRKTKYLTYINEQKARIDAVAEQQKKILTRENPTPGECISIVEKIQRNLWERSLGDRDFLDIRLGMGYEDLCVSVKTNTGSSRVEMEEDEIRELSEALIEETRIVDNIPLRLSLTENTTVGIVGHRGKTINLVRNMMINLTTLHCFEEVRIVGIFDEKERTEWESLRWLPHVWDENRQFRYLAFDKESTHNLCEIFHEVIKERRKQLSGNPYGKKTIQLPYYVFIFGSKTYMETEEIMSEVFMDTPEIGVTSLFLFDDIYSLPHDCKYIVDVDNGPCAYLRNEVNNKSFFTPDAIINNNQFDTFARKMAGIKLEGFAVRQEIPTGITFLQGYHVENIHQLDIYSRWKQSQPQKSLAAPIGVMAGNKTFSLDIHEKKHGPHGLVAGTTGSGKSELLQTWILSMAVNYHPYDVSFVIIDYKGGGMANLLEPLPHVVGKITNIGSNINRSLISLQSENKRRQIIFDKYGVNHIDKYQELYRRGEVSEPMPHLIIVADEFAELKKEEPEFMSGLVNVARVGRSLGVHMVLATQKPSGVVDDQIWSNSRFKLCLKVQDVGDSREMIKKPDAAYITQAGRSFVQVGNDEIFELFQSYWSGAPYFGNRREQEKVGNQVRIVGINGQRIKTVMDEKTRFKSEIDELTAIVNHICQVAEENNIKDIPGPLKQELPEELFLLDDIIRDNGFDGKQWKNNTEWLKTPMGMFDYPETQSQGIQYIDFEKEGHTGIYGAPSTGKTTLLKSIVLSLCMTYSPDDVNIYILDFGGWSMSIFADMPHCGGVALDSEEEKILKLEKLITEEFEARKKLLLQNAVNSLSSYRAAVSNNLPAIIIVVDNFVPIFDLYPNLENLFVTIAREGATYGIYLLFSANSTSGIRYKVMQNIRGAIAFELTDRGDYSTLVGRLEYRTLPKIQGRAFFKGNPPLEMQTAMYMKGTDEIERVRFVKDIIEKMNHAWTGKRPRPIPVMPENIGIKNMTDIYRERETIPFGIKYSDIQEAKLDLSDAYCLMVTGNIGSGKSKMLTNCAEILLSKKSENQVFVIDGSKKALHTLQDRVYKYTQVSEEEQLQGIIDELIDMLNCRKKAQNKAKIEKENSFDEKEFIAGYRQVCIFIDDIKEFVDSVSDEVRNSMERICRLAQHLGVIVFVAGRTADVMKYNEIETLTRAIIAYQKGILLEEAPSVCPYFKNSLKYNEKEISAGEGNAYMFDNGTCERIKITD